MAYDRSALIHLIRRQALQFGQFTLASGRPARYYLDCRQVTLDPVGANLIADGILQLLEDDLPDAVGGMAVGADPITAAIVTRAGQRGLPLRGFMVRKEAKDHGTGRLVEGPVAPGQRAVIVEDVLTSGASALRAAETVEALGLAVLAIVTVVDRLEGGAQNVASAGYQLKTLLTIRDLGIETA